MDLRQIGIVGSDAIGAGIAQTALQHGIEVILVDDTEKILAVAEERILRGLQRAEQPGAFSLMRKATRLDQIETCDLVVECGLEAPEAKMDLLRRIDARLEPPRVIAVQTAAMPISILGRAVENPDRLIGFHFFLPPSISRLVEVIHYEHASEAALQTGLDFVGKIEKTAVRCKDRAGFIVSRVARPLYLTAMRFLEKGRGTPMQIDEALKKCAGFPAGAFQILDFFGIEEDYADSEICYQLLGQPDRLKPTGIAEKLLAAGCRGYANSRGFYVYGENAPGTPNPLLEDLVPGYAKSPAAAEEIVDAVLSAIFTEAQAVVDEGIASAADVDTAMKLALHWPKGPFEWKTERERHDNA